jgi:hypothetical protein
MVREKCVKQWFLGRGGTCRSACLGPMCLGRVAPGLTTWMYLGCGHSGAAGAVDTVTALARPESWHVHQPWAETELRKGPGARCQGVRRVQEGMSTPALPGQPLPGGPTYSWP